MNKEIMITRNFTKEQFDYVEKLIKEYQEENEQLKQEVKNCNKGIQELITGRAKWKRKYYNKNAKVKELKSKLEVSEQKRKEAIFAIKENRVLDEIVCGVNYLLEILGDTHD